MYFVTCGTYRWITPNCNISLWSINLALTPQKVSQYLDLNRALPDAGSLLHTPIPTPMARRWILVSNSLPNAHTFFLVCGSATPAMWIFLNSLTNKHSPYCSTQHTHFGGSKRAHSPKSARMPHKQLTIFSLVGFACKPLHLAIQTKAVYSTRCFFLNGAHGSRSAHMNIALRWNHM